MQSCSRQHAAPCSVQHALHTAALVTTYCNTARPVEALYDRQHAVRLVCRDLLVQVGKGQQPENNQAKHQIRVRQVPKEQLACKEQKNNQAKHLIRVRQVPKEQLVFCNKFAR